MNATIIVTSVKIARKCANLFSVWCSADILKKAEFIERILRWDLPHPDHGYWNN
jgi:hypothetical protein